MEYEEVRSLITGELEAVLKAVDQSSVEKLADSICQADKVFVVGVGRVLLMLQAFVKRLNHLGIEAYYVGAINEPAITKEDLLLVGSGSGESIFPLEMMKKAKKFGATVVHIGSNQNSSMTEYEDQFVRLPCSTKLNLADEIESQQIMSSLFEQSLLLLLDGVALMIVEKKNIEDIHSLWRKHANLE